ncbi:uncharacterized protein LOC129894827 [Solanum dulcamara]|uniref:uncharacterized protein LOC129894827 n=1 Tax=Solanum dulcamara TaxID=45834 RepID=UPI0024856D3B|nr:uncharacterized protein LOC129894827 [Solanum dulcamara]
MRKFVSGLGKHVKKECKASLLISDMDISRLMKFAQQVEDDKIKDREEHLSKKAKSTGHENEQRQGKGNTSFFQKRSSNYARSTASAPSPSHRGGGGGRPQVQFSQGQYAHGGGQCTNCFYALPGRQKVEEEPNMVTSMLEFFNFDVYALLDPDANLSFITPFLANRSEILQKC